MSLAPLAMEALAFAARAHSGQHRTGNRDPYVNHVIEVAQMVASVEPDDAALIAACVLHDVLEETPVTADELRTRFGNAVTAIVLDVTDPEGLKGRPRRQRQVDHTAVCGRPVRLLKLADKISNVEELLDIAPERFDAGGAHKYLKWARRVVDVCRGEAPALEARFDASAARLESVIERPKVSASSSGSVPRIQTEITTEQ